TAPLKSQVASEIIAGAGRHHGQLYRLQFFLLTERVQSPVKRAVPSDDHHAGAVFFQGLVQEPTRRLRKMPVHFADARGPAEAFGRTRRHIAPLPPVFHPRRIEQKEYFHGVISPRWGWSKSMAASAPRHAVGLPRDKRPASQRPIAGRRAERLL